MQDKTLLLISMISGLLGCIVLTIIMLTSPQDKPDIAKLDDSYIDKHITLTGIVKKVTHAEKTTFIELSTTQTTTGVVFENISIEPGTRIELHGKVQDYNGKKEIIIEEIKKLS